MTRDQLIQNIRSKQSFLCVGLDPDQDRMPEHLPRTKEGISEFCRSIIDETKEHCVAYKPNWAFFEAFGLEGMKALDEVMKYIPATHLKIADAKRGDIGNTSKKYAKSIFDGFGADAITIAPYMGEDSVTPFIRPEKWVVVLALTSNKGSSDFQRIPDGDGVPLFYKVLERTAAWGSPENTMFVVGATHPEEFKQIRQIVPSHFLLVPGIGAQGGSLTEVCANGMNDDIGLLVNSSRSIIYSDAGPSYAKSAGQAAADIQSEMRDLL